MSEVVKTVVFAASAVGLALIAGISSPGAVEPVFFSDVGEPFFPSFTDPTKAASLEVWEFDGETGEAVPFNVGQENGVWTIPSHHGYPADAKDRMSEAAALLIGLRKASVRSDLKSDHASFGLIDPSEAGLELEGRGKRVTFKDKGGAVLADLIIGHEVKDKRDSYYVRFPEKKRTYVAEIKAKLSTKFEDWIDRDLLKSDTLDISGIVFDNYSVDEERGTLLRGEKVVMTKDGADWKVADVKEGEETNQDKAREVVSTLSAIKIVGVRTKPEGLTAQLEVAQGIERAMLSQVLSRRGYFFAQGKLYSNEGDLLINNSNGLVYTLKFGEIVFGTGNMVTSGEDNSGRKRVVDPKTGEEAAAEEQEGSHRYLMITVQFDPALLDQPEGTPLAQEELDKRATARRKMEEISRAIDAYKGANEDRLPSALADLLAGEAPQLSELEKDPWDRDYVFEATEEGFRIVCLGADGAAGGEGPAEDLASDAWSREDDLTRVAADHKAYNEKVATGTEQAAGVEKRLGAWYYVIDAESFSKLKLGREDLVKAVDAEPEPGESAPPALLQPGK